jgi:hypothetical protein
LASSVRASQRDETRAWRDPQNWYAHLRRVLVEAAWHYRHRPFVGGALRRRQQGAGRFIVVDLQKPFGPRIR